jgi:hypothetical protein
LPKNSIYDEAQSVDAGFAVDSCDIVFIDIYNKTFRGLAVSVDVRDVDAYLFKVGFHVILFGKLVVSPIMPPQ